MVRKLIRITGFCFFCIIMQMEILFSANPGDIVITEFFFQQSTGGTLPEYVELFNSTSETISLQGWTLEINGTGIDDSEKAITGALTIESEDYIVLFYGVSGEVFRDELGLTYCSSYNSGFPNACTNPISSLYWQSELFDHLSSSDGEIKIWEDLSDSDPIDKVIYNANDFPVGDDIYGYAAEFMINPAHESILDPDNDDNGSTLNDNPIYWRSSPSQHAILYNAGTVKLDHGSPLDSNYIDIAPTVANSLDDVTVNEDASDTSIVLTAVFTDVDNYDFRITKNVYTSKEDSNLVIGQIDGDILTLDYQNDHNGTAEIIVLAESYHSDGTSTDLTVTDTFTVKINAVNDAPSFTKGTDQTVLEDSGQSTITNWAASISAGPSDEIGQTITFAVSNDNNSLFSSQPVISSSGTLTFTPTTDTNGSATITVNLSDDGETINTGADDTSPDQTFTITVTPVNDATIIDSLWFNNFVIHSDNYYHIAEDTVDIDFGLIFHDIDSDSSLNYNAYNLDSLRWSFQGLNGATDQKVYASRVVDGFKIDSLYSNFNGATNLRVIVEDEGNLRDTIDIPIYIDQRNDSLLQFQLHPVIQEYSIDATTIESVRDVVYFRLPQDDEKKTIRQPEKLRFEWDKKDLDIDTNPELNKGDSLHLYYRLEAVLSDTFFIILRDSIDHGDALFANSINSIFADINITDEFIYYVGSYEDHPKDTKTILDTTGYTSYEWRVVAQNYQKDNLGHDPFQISLGVDSTDFRIDFIPPEVTDFNIMINTMYPGYYDALWESNGLYLTDSTFININEDSNQFAAVSLRNPRQLTDSLYHFTGIIPVNLISATINYNVQLRDKAMNSGEWTNTVSYCRLSSSNSTSCLSSSGLARIFIDQSGVNESGYLFITEDNVNTITKRNTSDIYQLTPSINFSPKDIVLNNQGEISFDINEHLSPDIYDWQYVIMEMNDNGYEPLATCFSDGKVSAHIYTLSSFAVYVNLDITKPIPTTFKLQQNYPNPFNPTTIIPLEIPEKSFVKASIYNILGQEVVTLLEGIQSSGYYDLQWNGNNQFGQQVSAGIYFVRVRSDEKVFTNKMMFLK